MALLSTLVKAIADAEGLEETQVAWIARHLREAGLLSQAGRGRGAAHMTVTDAANLLIGINATSNVKTASKTVKTFRELPIIDSCSHSMTMIETCDDQNMSELELAFAAGSKFGDVLEVLVRAYSLGTMEPGALDVGHGVAVIFERPLPSASVFIADGDDENAKGLYAAEFRRNSEAETTLRPNRSERITITGEVLFRASEAIFK